MVCWNLAATKNRAPMFIAKTTGMLENLWRMRIPGRLRLRKQSSPPSTPQSSRQSSLHRSSPRPMRARQASMNRRGAGVPGAGPGKRMPRLCLRPPPLKPPRPSGKKQRPRTHRLSQHRHRRKRQRTRRRRWRTKAENPPPGGAGSRARKRRMRIRKYRRYPEHLKKRKMIKETAMSGRWGNGMR